MSSYASPELTTLFKWILEPQSKTIQSETLNQTQTAAKTTMTIMPKKSKLEYTARDINSSKNTYVKPQATDGFKVNSKIDILTPVIQSLSVSRYQGQITSTSADPSQNGNIFGYYALFNPPEGVTEIWANATSDSHTPGYYSVYTPTSTPMTTVTVSPPTSNLIGGNFISSSNQPKQVLKIQSGAIPEAQQIFVIPGDKSATIRFDIVPSKGPVTDVAIKKLNIKKKTFDVFLPTKIGRAHV